MTHLQTRAAERYDQARTHFRAIYGDQAQWIELSAIEGDPDDRQHCRFRRGIASPRFKHGRYSKYLLARLVGEFISERQAVAQTSEDI